MKNHVRVENILSVSFLFLWLTSSHSLAAISLDRTRVILNENENTVVVNISNDNKQLPYLAQTWLEDGKMNKINKGPIVLTPPIQRIEPGERSLITLTTTSSAKQLPTDRESVFYFILREIPPKSKKENVMQIALQTKVKLFYRPKSIEGISDKDWYKDIKLKYQDNGYRIVNPTPLHLTVVGLAGSEVDIKKNKFDGVMVEPKSELFVKSKKLSTPYMSFINDYGGRPVINFTCVTDECIVN
ncbi:molecular chaperone [Salmonella enterica]|nr:molecular chaperone [Salmonella enterica]ECX8200055.1 molecular chaperone [Salmonella enterica]ELE6319728.1 molecular chaperone [Salmonella enterica]